MEARAFVRAKAIGGSLFVRIPVEIARQENIHENETVEIRIRKMKKSYFGAFKGLKHVKHEKFSDFD